MLTRSLLSTSEHIHLSLPQNEVICSSLRERKGLGGMNPIWKACLVQRQRNSYHNSKNWSEIGGKQVLADEGLLANAN